MGMGPKGDSGKSPNDPDRSTTERTPLRELLTQIQRLAVLWNDGCLTDAEFEAIKAKLINRP